MKTILSASRRLVAPLGEGGGEISVYSLMSYLHSTGRYRSVSVGALEYAELPSLVDVLKSLETPLKVQDEIAQVTIADGPYAYPRRLRVFYQMPCGLQTMLARKDHYFETLVETVETTQPIGILLHGSGSFEAAELLRESRCSIMFYAQSIGAVRSIGGKLPSNVIVLANSEFTADTLAREFGIHSHLLYPSIQIERYATDEPRAQRERLTVLFVNPVLVKGLFVFLHLLDAFPEVDFVVLEGWRPIDDKLARHLERSKNARWIRKTWDMPSIFRQVDLLIIPSQLEEAFGRVVIEAHAAGVPTLASRVGGLPEASGEAGMLVDDYKNPRAWASALREIIDMKERLEVRRELMTTNAMRFSSQEVGQRFEELIRS